MRRSPLIFPTVRRRYPTRSLYRRNQSMRDPLRPPYMVRIPKPPSVIILTDWATRKLPPNKAPSNGCDAWGEFGSLQQGVSTLSLIPYVPE